MSVFILMAIRSGLYKRKGGAKSPNDPAPGFVSKLVRSICSRLETSSAVCPNRKPLRMRIETPPRSQPLQDHKGLRFRACRDLSA